ncbi:MAG: hypothetical protein AB8B54_01030 [Sphingorhabdus sp.]
MCDRKPRDEAVHCSQNPHETKDSISVGTKQRRLNAARQTRANGGRLAIVNNGPDLPALDPR